MISASFNQRCFVLFARRPLLLLTKRPHILVCYGRSTIIIMALSSLPTEMQSNHGNTTKSAPGHLGAVRTNTITTSNWLSTTFIARYYVIIIMAAIPVLSWNLSMHNSWTEMSAVEEFLIFDHDAKNARRNSDTIHPSTHHVLDEHKEAAVVDIQYMELPNGISATIKKGPKIIRPSKQTQSHINNNNNNPHVTNQAPTSRNRNIRIRVSPQGDIDIKDPDDTISNHHHHDKSTNSTMSNTERKPTATQDK